MEAKNSLPRSRESGPRPDPDASRLHPQPHYVYDNFNII
jgi:hypothetical protein